MHVPDFESYLGLISADKLLPWPEQWEQFQQWMRDRRAMVDAGLLRCPPWFQDELAKIDPRLRAWWDSWKEEWVIDRLQDAGIVERLRRAAREERQADVAESMTKSAEGMLNHGAFYLTLIHFKPTPTLQLDQQLLDMLRSCDMQRYGSPEEYTAEKKDAAEQTRRANDQAGSEKVKAAVDRLSEKQLKQFIEVSEAIASGETIVAHGSDLRFVENARRHTVEAVAREEEEQTK